MLEQEVITNLYAMPKVLKNMLPHAIYIEERREDRYSHGIPVYTMYRLEEICTDGSCTLYDVESRKRFTCCHLCEVNMDWLVVAWERCLEFCIEQDIWREDTVAFLKGRTDKPEEEIISFVEASWDKCQTYTDNLKASPGEDKDREIWAFSFLLDEFERDVPAGKIIVNYESNPATRVEEMTPLEFTANINNECFNDRNN